MGTNPSYTMVTTILLNNLKTGRTDSYRIKLIEIALPSCGQAAGKVGCSACIVPQTHTFYRENRGLGGLSVCRCHLDSLPTKSHRV
jgi:hypothetical protein